MTIKERLLEELAHRQTLCTDDKISNFRLCGIWEIYCINYCNIYHNSNSRFCFSVICRIKKKIKYPGSPPSLKASTTYFRMNIWYLIFFIISHEKIVASVFLDYPCEQENAS